MEERKEAVVTGYAGILADQEFAEEFTRLWKIVSRDPDFQSREDYPALLEHVDHLGFVLGLELLSEEQQGVLAAQDDDDWDEGESDDDDEEEEEENQEESPLGHEPVRMNARPDVPPDPVARPHGAVRVFGAPFEGNVVLDVIEPDDVARGMRVIAYLTPADAEAIGRELIGMAMDMERYAREGYR